MNPEPPVEDHSGALFLEAVAWYINATVGGQRDGWLGLPELQKAVEQQSQRYLQAYGDLQANNDRLQAWKNIQKLRMLEEEIKQREQRGKGAFYPDNLMEMNSINHDEAWNSANTIDTKAEFQKRCDQGLARQAGARQVRPNLLHALSPS